MLDNIGPSARVLELVRLDGEAAGELAAELMTTVEDLFDRLESGPSLSVSEIALAADLLGASASYLAGMPGADPGFSISLRVGTVNDLAMPVDALKYVDQVISIAALLDSWLEPVADRYTDVIRDYSWNAREAGKRMAERVRNQCGLPDDPILDLVGFVEQSGVPVLHRSLPAEIAGLNVRQNLDGSCRRAIVVNAADVWARQRYTLAHEFCHGLYNDDGQTAEKHHDIESPESLPEIRANAFARHLLLPPAALSKYLDEARANGVRRGEMLANAMIDFGVSRQVVLNALVDDELVPRERVDPLREVSVAELMRRSERLDDWLVLSREQGLESASPMLVERAVIAYGHGFVKSHVVATLLEESVDETELRLRDAGWLDLR